MKLFANLLVAFALLATVHFMAVRAAPSQLFKRQLKWAACPTNDPVPALSVTTKASSIVPKKELWFEFTGNIDAKITDQSHFIEVSYLTSTFGVQGHPCTDYVCKGKACPIPAGTQFTGKTRCDATGDEDLKTGFVAVAVFDSTTMAFAACSYAAVDGGVAEPPQNFFVEKKRS